MFLVSFIVITRKEALKTRTQKTKFPARYREETLEPQPLWDHLNNVAQHAKKLAGKIGLALIGELLGLLHDLSKATREFVIYLRYHAGLVDKLNIPLHGGKLDHATGGAQVLYERFSNQGKSTLTGDILSLVVASHHGFIDALTPDGKDNLGTRLAKSEDQTRKEQALSSLPPDIAARIEELMESGIDDRLQRFLTKAMEENYGVDEKCFAAGLLARYLLSCLIDADRTDAANFSNPEVSTIRQQEGRPSWEELVDRFEKHLASFSDAGEMNRLRGEISDKCASMATKSPGFFRLSVPTGTGKTLASLRFALRHVKEHDLNKIIYVIPYTSIIDQNAQSVRKALKVDLSDSHIVLEHHSNLIKDKADVDSEEAFSKKYELLAENWDSPIILTTMVQFLESLYGGSNSCRRMHQLAKSVIIFDEIQTLPINMVHLFNMAAKFLVNSCGSSILLCTATQPILHKVQPLARALPFDPEREIKLDPVQQKKTLHRVEVVDHTRPTGWSTQEIAQLAIEKNNFSRSVLIIVNTKTDARKIYHHLKQAAKGLPLYHLSTNMCPAHRKNKLNHILNAVKKHEPLILTSTQLIEAGVDVDFDIVIRSLAGLDSIAQAAGRCNRHGSKAQKGQVILVNSKEEHLSSLPTIKIGQECTKRVLTDFRRAESKSNKKHLLSDEWLNLYFSYYFYENSKQMDYTLDQNSPVGRSDNLVSLLAANHKSAQAYRLYHKNHLPNRVLRQSFRTAAAAFEVIPNQGQGVIVPYGQGKEIIAALTGAYQAKNEFALLRTAQQFSVNCFTHELAALSRAGALHEVQEGSGIFYLNETFYHDELGWTPEQSTKMSLAMP